MPFIKSDNSLINSSYTLVDNQFITRFMPDTEPFFISVYLFGLYLSQTGEGINTQDTMQTALNLSEDEIRCAYAYWEELGLCTVIDGTPFQVIYNPVRSGELYKKIKPSKYKTFNKNVQTLLCDRMITPSEFNEYYLFLEESFFEPEALVAVVKYCVAIKGANVAYSYILAVARNLNKQGVRTEDAVNARLNKPLPYLEDLRTVLRSLGLRRSPEFADKELYEKWINEYGFVFLVIDYVAKNYCKRGGMDFLDKKLSEFYRQRLFSVREIEEFNEARSRNTDLARKLVKQIGLYYQNVDFIVEDYLIKWLTMGFDEETLLNVAKYCSTCNIRTLSGLDDSINRFYNLGITTTDAINSYLEAILTVDREIKKLLEAMGIERKVNKFDRQCYRQWTEIWGLPLSLINHAATAAATAYNPMAYLNKILADYKNKGILSVEQAKAHEVLSQSTEKPEKKKSSAVTETRDYSKEELDALFTVFD